MTLSVERAALGLVALAAMMVAATAGVADDAAFDPAAESAKVLAKMNVKPGDYPQFGFSHYRNNVSGAKGIPISWDVKTGMNVKWSAKLGSQCYACPVVANGKVFIGSNNAHGYLRRFPAQVDLSVLLCFDEQTGGFLWQHSNEKLPIGRVHDWEQLGICSSVYVEGNRLWYITNRDEVVCLDTEGFLDGENDGPFRNEPNQNRDEADVVWKFDMIGQLGAAPHNQSVCSVTAFGETLLVGTSNGVDEGHKTIQKPDAPSFVAMDKRTGKILWTDNSPGSNIMHAQWSSPACGVFDGVAQAIFCGGDGWLYGFDLRGEEGRSKLLWKFDCNPKQSNYRLERATRNPLIATPVIYDGRVYVGVGKDPEHGEGRGHLWCIDPTRRGDVSPTLVFNEKDPRTPIPHKRLKACEPEKGDFERDNDNSALVWHYVGDDPLKFEQTMHRTIGSVAIKNDLLFVSDENGLLHCLDARTGKAHWTHDLLCSTWSTQLIVGEFVYISNQDGNVVVFELSNRKEQVCENEMESPIFNTPIVANGVLFVATMNTLYAITGDDGDESRSHTWAFGRKAGAIRNLLDTRMQEKIEVIDKTCDLSEAQRQKLRLAGRGDLQKVLDAIEDLRSNFDLVKRDDGKADGLLESSRPFRNSIERGPYRDGLLVEASLKSMLSVEQRGKYESLRAVFQAGGHVHYPKQGPVAGFDIHLRGIASPGEVLAQWKKRKDLRWLDLEAAQVTDAELAHLEGATNLEYLNLKSTRVTDDGLAHLEGLANLRELVLSSTQVTDAGLVHLKRLAKLEKLGIGETKVTARAIDELHQQLPNVKFERK